MHCRVHEVYEVNSRWQGGSVSTQGAFSHFLISKGPIIWEVSSRGEMFADISNKKLHCDYMADFIPGWNYTQWCWNKQLHYNDFFWIKCHGFVLKQLEWFQFHPRMKKVLYYMVISNISSRDEISPRVPPTEVKFHPGVKFQPGVKFLSYNRKLISKWDYNLTRVEISPWSNISPRGENFHVL